jgi:uncharacterized protein YjdB
MTMKRRIAWARSAGVAASLSVVAFLGSCGGDSSGPTPPVASVEVTPPTSSKEVGETVQLSATVKDASGNILSGQSVTWSSSATAVASVSGAGLVTANALGTATISAASGGKSGSATITVVPEPIASIELSTVNDTLLIGETLQLSATLRDQQNNVITGRAVTWTSNGPNVASVSGQGLVTAVGDGVTTITASLDGKSASATIRVFGPCSTALAQLITVGQTIDGALASTDCRLNDNTFTDGYAIQVTSATNVQIDMTATFDTYLFLLELTVQGNLIQSAFNDDVDPDDPADPNDTFDTNSRIVFELQPGVEYFILANSFDPNVFGDYQLKVAAVTPFVARLTSPAKPGKAPLSSLLKGIRP